MYHIPSAIPAHSLIGQSPGRVCSSSGQESKTPVHKNGPHQAGGVGFPLKGPLDKGHGLQNQTKKESLVSGTRRSWPVQVH